MLLLVLFLTHPNYFWSASTSCVDHFAVFAPCMTQHILDMTLNGFSWHCLEFTCERGYNRVTVLLWCLLALDTIFSVKTLCHVNVLYWQVPFPEMQEKHRGIWKKQNWLKYRCVLEIKCAVNDNLTVYLYEVTWSNTGCLRMSSVFLSSLCFDPQMM